MWDQIFGAVKEQLPRFNRHLLVDYRRQQIGQLAEYMDIVYKEAVKLVESGNLVYKGFVRLTPEERIRHLIESTSKSGSMRFRLEIQPSEMELVRYIFDYRGQEYYVHLTLPYLVNDQMIIHGTAYHFQLPIIERIIYRIPDGLIVKVMRSPLQFWRKEQYSYQSEEGKLYYDPIITVKAHYGGKERKDKREIKTALVLYLLADRGMARTLQTLGMDPSHVQFLDKLEKQDTEFEYFRLRKDRELWMKVHKSIFDNTNQRRVVASLHYLMQFFGNHDIGVLYDEQATIFKILLGKSIHGVATKETMAHSNVENHQKSLSTYLDPMTKQQLYLLGIRVEDIYQLFVHIFLNMDDLILNHSPSDLFEKKVGVRELLLAQTIRNTFSEFYTFCKREQRQPGEQIMRALARKLSRPIAAINDCGARNAPFFNDNWLLTIGGKKVRQAANQQSGKRGRKKGNLLTNREHFFHPSMMVIESVLSIPSSNPGVGGDINPFAPTDEECCFIMPPWAEEVYRLMPYLLNK